jgi:predicted Zn-ribbon and HTH transcriptional regulator
MVVPSYCRECDRGFYVVDDPDLQASYRCPVCLTPGVAHPDAPEAGAQATAG